MDKVDKVDNARTYHLQKKLAEYDDAIAKLKGLIKNKNYSFRSFLLAIKDNPQRQSLKGDDSLKKYYSKDFKLDSTTVSRNKEQIDKLIEFAETLTEVPIIRKWKQFDRFLDTHWEVYYYFRDENYFSPIQKTNSPANRGYFRIGLDKESISFKTAKNTLFQGRVERITSRNIQFSFALVNGERPLIMFGQLDPSTHTPPIFIAAIINVTRSDSLRSGGVLFKKIDGYDHDTIKTYSDLSEINDSTIHAYFSILSTTSIHFPSMSDIHKEINNSIKGLDQYSENINEHLDNKTKYFLKNKKNT